MFKHISYVIVAVSILLWVPGCSSRYFSNKSVDVSDDRSWWGELTRGEVLQLNRDVLFGPQGLHLSAWVPTGPQGMGEKISVEQYQADPNRYSGSSLRFVPKGTRLKCMKLERFFSFEYSQYRVYAEILDGALKGRVTNVPVTGNPYDKGTLRLNAEFLEPVK